MSTDFLADRDAFFAQHPERRRQLNGRDWGMISVGSGGPALILLPGTLGRADIFWQQMQELAGDCRILALSYPASGGVVEWAADIAALVKAEQLENTVLLGSSLGGYVAQYTTATYPSLFGGLVAANTLPSTRGLDQVPPYSHDLAAVPIDTLRAGFTDGLLSWITPDNPYAGLARFLMSEVQNRIPQAELRARLDALKSAPVLPKQTLSHQQIFTVESDDDHLIPAPVRVALRDTLQPDRAFRFRTASHFPYVTNPKAYSALLREALGLSAAATPWLDGKETIL